MRWQGMRQEKEGQMSTILLVEDEPLIRMAACAALEDADYQVLEAGDGNEGVDVFFDHLGQIDLVLLDIQMPLLNGYEVLEKLRFVEPDVKVIFLTAVVIDWEDWGVADIIQKPFDSRTLVRKVKEVLG